MPPRIQYFPTLAAYALGAISGILLFVAVFWFGNDNHNLTIQNDYGNALASMTAKRAAEASFNNDLVRLQILLEDVVSQPHLVQATVHNNENTLLVQAGEIRPTEAGLSAYTTSIVLHKRIAGYITLTLRNFDERTHRNRHAIAIALAIFAGLIVWSLYKNRALVRTKPPFLSRKEKPHETTPARNLPDCQSITQSDTPRPLCVSTMIHIKNLDELKQQLGNETFLKTITKFETFVADVLALYNGNEMRAEKPFYRLTFGAPDASNEAIFRATCSAFLLLKLAYIIDKIPLDLAAFVSVNETDVSFHNLSVSGLVLDAQAAEDRLVKRRLKFVGAGTQDGQMKVTQFEEPFATLLENQYKQLSYIQIGVSENA